METKVAVHTCPYCMKEDLVIHQLYKIVDVFIIYEVYYFNYNCFRCNKDVTKPFMYYHEYKPIFGKTGIDINSPRRIL